MFGLDIPECKQFWGCRAIFDKNGYIDIVHDRKNSRNLFDSGGMMMEHVKPFSFWLDKVALPALREWAKNIPTNSREVFEFKTFRFIMRATPNASYGYMYVGAGILPQEGENNNERITR